jgi:hypothetical protein
LFQVSWELVMARMKVQYTWKVGKCSGNDITFICNILHSSTKLA